MTLDEVTQRCPVGSVVSFREWSLDRRERRSLSLSIDHAQVHEVIPPMAKVGRAHLGELYGEGLPDVAYEQLSQLHDLRLVLSLGMTVSGRLDLRVVQLNEYYLAEGLQEVIVEAATSATTERRFIDPMGSLGL